MTVRASVDPRRVAKQIERTTVGGGDMKYATVTIGDHVSAIIVFGIDRKEADERAMMIADAWNLTYGRET